MPAECDNEFARTCSSLAGRSIDLVALLRFTEDELGRQTCDFVARMRSKQHGKKRDSAHLPYPLKLWIKL